MELSSVPQTSQSRSPGRRRVPSSEWWRTEGDFFLLSEGDKTAQAPAAADFLEAVAHFPKGARILDLGCGYGRITLELARRGYRVTGLDYSRVLQVGRALARRD